MNKTDSPEPYPRDDIAYASVESPTLELNCNETINGSCWYDDVHAELRISGDDDVLSNYAITLGKNKNVRTTVGSRKLHF